MATITFDTLKFVTRLKESGLSETQSVAITEAFREAHGEAEVATKADIRELEFKFEARMSENKAELVRWIIGAGFFQTVLIAALLMKLIR
jgi:hypothetical protein